jgi:tetratricopeptide (TPR) repeat protein
MLAEIRQFRLSLRDANAALNLDGGSLDGHRIKVHALWRLGETKAGLEAVKQSLQLHPNDAQLWYSNGRLLQALGTHREALDSFTKALAIKETADSYRARSESYCKLQRQQEAQEDSAKAKQLGGPPEPAEENIKDEALPSRAP